MTVAMDQAVSVQRRAAGWPAMVRIGLRELRGGLSGFYVFIACLALGVMVIAAVGALGDALVAGFERQGRTILGGDMTFARMHTRATDAERSALGKLGTLSETAALRTMARRPDGQEQALIELKAVDSAYPLAGNVLLQEEGDFKADVAQGGAVADAMLLEQLGLAPGDRIKIGDHEIEVRAILKSEPDGVADRLTYGPRVFVSLDTLEKTGLVKPGTLIRWRYALARNLGYDEDKVQLNALRDAVQKDLPESGFTVLDRTNPSPQVTRTLERLRQFLILIGLASLLVGGIGIANAVATFIDKRLKVIATLRSIGATGGQIMSVFLVQILAMTALGIIAGLAAGLAIPGFVEWLVGDAMPVKAQFTISPRSLGIATAYGLMVALLFTLWPLGRAEHVRASVLFRDTGNAVRGWPRRALIVWTIVLVAALFSLALATSQPKQLAVWAFAALVAMLVVFSGLAWLVTRIARALPRPKNAELAIALRNVAATDGLTRAVILSLGTGLSLLVGVALVNTSLVEELKGRLPEDSPDYFLLDVPKQDYDALSGRVQEKVPGAVLTQAAMLRGRIVKLKGVPAEDLKAPPEAQWVLNGDRGLSYSQTVPEGSNVTEGAWWTPDYSGPPLVSFEAELASKLGLKLGDTVTVNVLGRNIEATISNLREVHWENLAINFVMVFSPNTLQAAPHNLLATIRLPDGTPGPQEVAMIRDLGRVFPAVSAIRVRDAINQFNKIFDKVMNAVQVAGSVTLLAGALVLAGALSTAQRRRILEAVILKTIGGTRWQILRAHAYEYAFLALAAALVAILLGAAAAWAALYFLMETPFTFSVAAVFKTLAAAGGLIAVFGGAGTWAVMKAPAVPYLRGE
ncbi:MAG: FtsX-like permease family protein [Hyphomicrobium sp.]|nr:FtsX-like permease family protein [Hyphomicrobium sp.]